MAHKIALRVANRIVAGQAVAVEKWQTYVSGNYAEGADKTLTCCAAGMLYVGTFLIRGGHIENVTASYRRYKYRSRFLNKTSSSLDAIAAYARVPEELARKLERLHLQRDGKTCNEIVAMLRNGELDSYCV